jgi:hypothetical protein
VQSSVQNGPLGLRIGRDLVQALPQAGLHLVGPVLEQLEGVVALVLERRAQAGEALLDA